MGRDRARNLEWGSANRPKVSNRLGIPNPREGSDGDMQVRQTGLGARLFAKIGGRWLSNILYGNEIDSTDVFIPKVWHKRDSTLDSLTTTIYLPEFINDGNILSINFMINLGGDQRYHFFSWDTPGTEGETGTTHSHAQTSGHPSDNNMLDVYYDRPSNSISAFTVGSSTRAKEYRLTVFFK